MSGPSGLRSELIGEFTGLGFQCVFFKWHICATQPSPPQTSRTECLMLDHEGRSTVSNEMNLISYHKSERPLFCRCHPWMDPFKLDYKGSYVVDVELSFEMCYSYWDKPDMLNYYSVFLSPPSYEYRYPKYYKTTVAQDCSLKIASLPDVSHTLWNGCQ